MTAPLEEIIRRHVGPLAPLPTAEIPRLTWLPDIRAVLFDVYGTMLISASGEVGTAASTEVGTAASVKVGTAATDGRAEALAAAFETCGLSLVGDPQAAVESLMEAIHQGHQRLKAGGVEYPEVDIRTMWRQVVNELVERGRIAPPGEAPPGETPPGETPPGETPPGEALDYERLSLEYEMRANPVWPMPGVEQALEKFRAAGLRMGIISNAQFFTLPVIEALLGSPLARLGFPENLQFYSYRYDCAKPGPLLFQRAREALGQAGVEPGEALYVGNDMLNDMLPAAGVGFRTALFAGDARSLRLREGDPRVAGLRPDVVVTRLDQLNESVFP